MDHMQPSALNAGIAAASIASGYLLYKTFSSASPNSKHGSTVKSLRGPKADSFFMGNFAQALDPDMDIMESWLEDYGTTLAIYGPLSAKCVYSADPKVAAYVFNNSMRFEKPWFLQEAIKQVTGPGVFGTEGHVNKKQRKVLNSAFNTPQVQQMNPVLMSKAQQLRDAWLNTIASTDQSGTTTIDVLDWLNKVALDVIGEAGFSYEFNSLRDASLPESSNEMANAFNELLRTMTGVDLVALLGYVVPATQKLPFARNKLVSRCVQTMRKFGIQIVEERKAELVAKIGSGSEVQNGIGSEVVEKDIISALLRCNLDESSEAKMDDEEVLAQIATFLIAGTETLGSAMTWALYALSKNNAAKSKLRDEILACPTDDPSVEELNALTYLDAVVKEVLRLHIPVPLIQRTPLKDEIISLSDPVTDRSGKQINEIFLGAGETIVINTGGLNYGKHLWGPDAHEFKPERFEALPKETAGIPSGYANITTFISGPRMCIGWKLVVAEMKAVLFTLVRTFDFDIDPTLVIGKKSTVAARPFVVGDDPRTQLPLRVSLHKEQQTA